MNVLIFTGNLGRDAEVKYLPSGTAICEFSVAMKSGYGDRDKTNWVKCKMFGKKAEGGLPAYLLKGTQVAISGELELEEWDGNNGKGAALSLSVNNIDLIGGGPSDQSGKPSNNPPSAPKAPKSQSDYMKDEEAKYWAAKDRDAHWAILTSDVQKYILDNNK